MRHGARFDVPQVRSLLAIAEHATTEHSLVFEADRRVLHVAVASLRTPMWDAADEEAWDSAGHAGRCAVQIARARPDAAARLLPTAVRRLRLAMTRAPSPAAAAFEALLQEALSSLEPQTVAYT